MNPCKGVKRKAEAPSLSSWTLYLQAGLISGGWHPWFPEQVGEDLQRDDAKGTPRGEDGDSRVRRTRAMLKRQRTQSAGMQRGKEVRRKMLMMLIILSAC